jgi:mitochondrial fission protein ELM1
VAEQPQRISLAASPEARPTGDPQRPRSVWVFKCHRPGDHAQSIALADALGWPYAVKEMKFLPHEIYFALRGEATLAGIDRRRSSPLEPPWPDLIILAGRQNETPAKWVRKQSGGRTRIVVIGRYWTPADRLDLVVTPPQFRLREHPHVLINDFPLHQVTREKLDEAAGIWRPRLAGLPHPWIALIVGGSSGPYVFSRETARRLGHEASEFARAHGGSLLVTTSPRTSRSAMAALDAAIEVPHQFYRWRPNDPDNPYIGYLALADRFIVTADSLSMLAEACASGRPVFMFEFGGGPAAMHGPRGKDPRIRQWWRWSQLKDQGLSGLPYALMIGLPPWRLNRSRDIRLAQDRFVALDRARWLGAPDGQRWHPAPLQDLDRAVARVRALFARAEADSDPVHKTGVGPHDAAGSAMAPSRFGTP